MKKRKIVLISLLVIVLLIVAAVLIGQKVLQDNLDQIIDLQIENVSLTDIPDGSYPGHYAAFPIEVDVMVTVSEYMIKEIKLVKHVHGQGATAEVITSHVVQAQSLDVDLIAGATYSSKVILKAIEEALNEAKP